MSINYKSMFNTVVSTVVSASDKYESVCDAAEAKIMKSLGSEKTMEEVANNMLDRIGLEEVKSGDRTIMSTVSVAAVATGVVTSSTLIGVGTLVVGAGALACTKIKKTNSPNKKVSENKNEKANNKRTNTLEDLLNDPRNVQARKEMNAESEMDRVCREAYALVAEQKEEALLNETTTVGNTTVSFTLINKSECSLLVWEGECSEDMEPQYEGLVAYGQLLYTSIIEELNNNGNYQDVVDHFINNK